MKRYYTLLLWMTSMLISSAQQVDWPSLTFTQITTNTFNSPARIANASDGTGRLFVAEQTGRIWIIQSNKVFAVPFLDLTARSNFLQLSSVAFPPGFATNNHFYVSYTRGSDGASCISRFKITANINLADPSSEQVLVVMPEPYGKYSYDVVGQIAFGSDGFLYIGSGDGGTLTNSQNSSTLLGKILRIDVESGAMPYAVPASNPFVGNTNYAPEIWAMGVRDPQMFSFDLSNGDLYLADSGNTYQEINYQVVSASGGENYGWPIMDATNKFFRPTGFTNYTSLIVPVFSYTYSQGYLVRGGYVYRGPSKARMNGVYFFGDLYSGRVWGLVQTGTNWQSYQVGQTSSIISAFGEDELGRLYFAAGGGIYQIQDSSQVLTPVFSPASGTLYSNAVNVSSATPGAALYYTTNGLDPTTLDPSVPSGGTILVYNGLTNKIRGFRPDLNPSAVTSAVYTVVAASPTFMPTQGPITNGTIITISCVSPGAVIFYTLDGTSPTTNSSIYSGPLTVNGGITVNAMAVAEGYLNSQVHSVFYNLVQVATPLFTPSSPITNGTSISISCATPGTVIYYTLDGSSPTTNSAIYSVPLTINSGITVNAFGVAYGYLNSQVESVYYALAPVATPVFNPPNSLIAYGTGIVISSATPGAVIYYTLDGSTPTTNSPIYSTPLVLSSRATLLAQAYRSDLIPSGLQGVNYTLYNFDHTVVTTLAGGPTPGFSNAVGTLASFSNPQGLCIDRSGNLYVADTGNNAVRKITPSGQVSTYAGTGVAGSQLGAAANAQFSAPTSVAIDQTGNVYVADPGNCNRICKITNAVVSVFASWISCNAGKTLWQIECDSAGNIYVGAGEGVDKITADGFESHIAGGLDLVRYDVVCSPGWCYGVGLGVDTSTNLYITTSALLYKLAPDGAFGLFAGNPTDSFGAPDPGFSDGPRLRAQFAYPHFEIYAIPVHYEDAAVDSATNVFVTDDVRIRKISPDGWVSTMAGNGTNGYQNGLGSDAEFSGVTGICVDTNGNIFVADSANNCIREISPDTYGIGIPDWWQLAHFGHVGIAPNSDPDLDGMSNYEEFWAGTDPRDQNSSLRFTKVGLQSNSLILNWKGGTNVVYYLKRGQGLNGTVVWQNIFTNVLTAASPQGAFLDSSLSNTACFYRLQAVP